MEVKDKSAASSKDKPKDPLETAQENVFFMNKTEECFAHVIKTIDNNEAAKGLRYCNLLCNNAWESLKQVLTTYRMSCLIVRIILCMDKPDFVKLCNYIDQKQVKQLDELYNAYQELLISYEKLSEDQCGFSSINLQFIYLTQQIHAKIKNPALLLEDCKRLMASKTYATPLFKADYLKGFTAIISKPTVLFQALGVFWTWSDHSILKELLHMGKHAEAVNLVDKFDRRLESFKSVSIEKFPLPILSSRMIPVDGIKQVHTMLAIKYKTSYHKCTWGNVSKAVNSLKDTFEITRNAMQLLGVLDNHSDYILIYWMIPTSVISLITSKITHFAYYSKLKKNSITEVAIYPKALFSADDTVRVGPLSFFMNVSAKEMSPLVHPEKENCSLASFLSRTEEIPCIMQTLLSKVNDNQAQLKHEISKTKELSIENEEKKDNIEIVLKKNADLPNTISTLEQEVERLQNNEKGYNEKIATNYEQLQTDLLQSRELLEEYEKKIQTLQQEKGTANYEQLQTDLLQCNELLKEYEENMQVLRRNKEKAELELRTSKESLEDELSNLQSQIMMKNTQNQTLSENNVSLTKHINKLKEKEKMNITEIGILTENNQKLNDQLQTIKDERDSEIKSLSEHADQIRRQNSNLITENDHVNGEKLCLQQQLKESNEEMQLFQLQMKQVKDDKLCLLKANRALKQQLTKCEDEKKKFMKAAHYSSKSAKNANSAVASLCERCIAKERSSRTRLHCSLSEASGRSYYDADDSSSSATSLSTAESKSTTEPSEETPLPCQVKDDLEDNEN